MAQTLLIIVLGALLTQDLVFSAVPSDGPPAAPAVGPTSAPRNFFDIELIDRHYYFHYEHMKTYIFGIPRDDLFSQVNCSVIFPDGALYNLWPNSNVSEPTITLPQNSINKGCYIGFRNPPPQLSGTFELISVVNRGNNSLMSVRRKLVLTFEWEYSAGEDIFDDDVFGASSEITV